MQYSEMIELTVIDFLLTGNSYWLKYRPEPDSGKPMALYRLPPPLITVVPGKTKPIDRYEYLPPGSALPLKYQPHEVLHIRRPNPHSQHFGAGIIAGGPQMFDAEIALTSSFGGYFARGTRLSGIIESERSIPDKLWRKIVREFRQMFSRNENSWDVAALERGLTYRPLSATAAQAEYQALIPLSRDRICAAFRVPPILLGQIGGTAQTAVKEAQRIFDNKTMRPFLNKLQEAITYGLTQAWDIDFKIDYEYTMPVEDQFEMAKDFATLPGVKLREVRERVGLPPLGDERDDMVLNLPGEEDNASNVKDRSIGSEPGRPPNPENTRAIPEPGEKIPEDAKVVTKNGSA
jgi:HK97 family phage portal protein